MSILDLRSRSLHLIEQPTLFDVDLLADTGEMTFTLTPYISRYLTERQARGELEPATAKGYRIHLGGLAKSFGNRPITTFGPAAIDRWIEATLHLAPSSRRLYLSEARGFCRWLRDQGVIRKDPTAHVRPIKQPRNIVVTFTKTEVARVLAVAPDLRARAIILLMVGGGARCVEVHRATVEDFHPAQRRIKLTGKDRHERLLPLNAETCHAVDAYLDHVGRTPGAPLIRSTNDPTQALLPASLGALIRGLLYQAGVKTRTGDGRSAHGLRRTAGSDIVDEVEDIRVAQEFLGHADIRTTFNYYLRSLTLDQLERAVKDRTYTHHLGTAPEPDHRTTAEAA